MRLNEKFVREKYDEDGILREFSLEYPENFNFAYDIVDEIARREPNRRALVWRSETGEEKVFSFGDISRMSNKVANYFKSLGIEKGDRVIIILKQRYEFWFSIVALHKIGAIAIPATYMLKKHDVEYRIVSSGAKAVICTSQTDVSDSFDEAENIPSLKIKVIVGEKKEGWRHYDSEIGDMPETWERVQNHAKDLMLIYFTSGTSGNPKMAAHDFRYPLAHIMTAKHWQRVVPDGIHFTVSDTGWGKAAWGKIYGQWIMEAAIFVYEYERFVPSDILNLIEEYGITTLCCPPTMFRLYINAGLEGHDLSSLTNCNIAGEALNPDTFNVWKKHTGLMLMEGFGQTETPCVVGNIAGTVPKPGSMGKPLPQYKVYIMDENDEVCPPGVQGEIVVDVHGDPPGIIKGYYKDPEITRENFKNGFHHTGDVAWMDEDGYFWYVGRNDDIIKSSGYRISPFEIESVLICHPAVMECAVTGVPDEVRGQLVKASVVLKDGYEPTDALKKEMQNYVKENTAPYKYPRVVDFVAALPKSTSGKIKRVDIRNSDLGKANDPDA